MPTTSPDHDVIVHGPAVFEGPTEFPAPPRGPREPGPELPAERTPERRLASGRRVEVRSESGTDDLVTIRGASGDVELEILVTATGPLLRFRSADVRIESSGNVEVDCARFHVRASEGIVEETGGDHETSVAGNASRSVRGDLRDEARAVEVRSRRGDVDIRANDDVRLNGERIKLNC